MLSIHHSDQLFVTPWDNVFMVKDEVNEISI